MASLLRPDFRLSARGRYVAGVGIAGLALLLQWTIRPWVGDRVPFLFVLPALVFSATALGRGPALVVVAAGAGRAVSSLPDSPVAPEVDPLRISQVFGNLLVNAAKYTDPGGAIRLSAKLEAGGLVCRVADNGIGLGPDQIVRLFEMFAQVPAAMGRSQSGLG